MSFTTPNFSSLSIRHKLHLMIIITGVLILGLLSAAFLVEQSRVYQQHRLQEMTVLSDLIGRNTQAALSFDHAEDAANTLKGLGAHAHVQAAYLYLPSGKIFADYHKSTTLPVQLNTPSAFPQAPSIQHQFTKHGLDILHPVLGPNKKVLGWVRLYADLDDYYQTLEEVLWIIFAVASVTVICTLLLAAFFQRLFTTPIFSLLETTRQVASENDYSLRAKALSHDELGQLTQGFNAMLEQIEQRDIELDRYRSQLQEQVIQRTHELAQSRDQALAASRAKSAFLANMSHELRTPLNAILGYAQLLNTEARESNTELWIKHRQNLEIIQRSGEHLLTLISDILDVTKIEAGQLELQAEPIDFKDFLENMKRLFDFRAKQKQLQFEYYEKTPLPHYVHADAQRLRQVLFNLLGNSVKFTEKGKIQLNVSYLDGQARFSVVDTGIGIAEEALEKIFEAFHQEGDIRRKSQGTGLGLSITRSLVKLMHGRIAVESTLTKGSTFHISLPLLAVPHTSKQLVPNDPVTSHIDTLKAQAAGKTLLLVDDNIDNLTLLTTLLSRFGFHLHSVESGKEALDYCHKQLPDLIFMDLMMPEMDGFECTQKIREMQDLNNPVIIAVSANVFQQNKNQAYLAGCDDFLEKPIMQAKLLALLQKYLHIPYLESLNHSSRSTVSDQAAQEKAQPINDKDWRNNLEKVTEDTFYTLNEAAKRNEIHVLREQVVALEEAQYPALKKHLSLLLNAFNMQAIRDVLAEHPNAKG